jgi:hypothetical protein
MMKVLGIEEFRRAFQAYTGVLVPFVLRERATPQHLDRLSWRPSTKKTSLIDDAPCRSIIRFLPSAEKGKHWRAPLGCIHETWMIDGPNGGRPRETGEASTGALAFPGYEGSLRGTPPHIVSRAAEIAKGRRTSSAPLFPSFPVPRDQQ